MNHLHPWSWKIDITMLYFLANQFFHNCISRLTILSVIKPVVLCLYFCERYFWCNVTVCICVHFYFIPPYWFATGSWNPSARKTMTQTRFYHHDDVMIWNKFPCYWLFHIFSEQTVEKWVDFTVICPTMTLVWPYIYDNVNDGTIIQVLLVGAMQRNVIIIFRHDCNVHTLKYLFSIKVCPLCKRSEFTSGLMGAYFANGVAFPDFSRVWCICAWTTITLTELVESRKVLAILRSLP